MLIRLLYYSRRPMRFYLYIFYVFGWFSAIAQENVNITRSDSSQMVEIDIPDPQVFKEKESTDRGKYLPEKNNQEIQTLSGSLHHSGGYGALFFKSSEFKGRSIILTGIRGVWVLNRAFGIGLEANGIIPVAKFEGIDPEGINKAILLGGYGGFFIEPIFWSNRAIHITLPVSAGSGWLGYIEDWDDNDQTYNYEDNLYGEDVYWYVEPGAVIELNISKSFRIDLGVSKRFTENLELISTDPAEFENINYTFTMKFGEF